MEKEEISTAAGEQKATSEGEKAEEQEERKR